MRNKLRAIWKILTSEYYLVIVGGGGCTAHLPKDMKTMTLMSEIVEIVEKLHKSSTNKAR